MKALSISLLALTLSSAYAATPVSNLQTTLTVQRSDVALAKLQKKQAQEEVAFEFEKTHTLLENSRDSKTSTTLTLPLGNNETTEITVQGKTNHVGQIIWQNGQFVPVEQSYLGFEGTTKAGERVRGFISEQSFSAIVHSAKNGRVLLRSKSLQVENNMTNVPPAALVDDVIDSPMNKLLSPVESNNFSSPVDAGYVQLRHVGMLFTLTDRLFHGIDPNGNAYQYNQQVTDWMADFAQQIDDVLKSRLGVTIESIGDGQAEKHGWYYYVQVPGGYPGQPADSIFGNTPTVPETDLGWAEANHKFQTWMVQNSAPAQKLATWWDLGIALGWLLDDHIFFNGDPPDGRGALGGVCNSSAKGSAYMNTTFDELKGSLHEIGHLLGANHTFSSQNGGCRNGYMAASSAVEPGSGSTLMSYAGACAPDDVQSQSDVYYHATSISQINSKLSFLESSSTCISHEPTLNRSPVLKMRDAPPQYYWNKVPKDVRFELNAQFEDPELEDLKQLAIDNNDPAWIPTNAKNYGAGYVNFEQCNSLADVGFFPPLYRSFAPLHTNPLPPSMDLDYPIHYKHSFPQETNPQGSRWDPLISTPGSLLFCITGWDNYGSPSNSFPAFVSTNTVVRIIDAAKPVFTFPQPGQTVTARDPQHPQLHLYNVTWIPNFAATQTIFSSVTLSYKDPIHGWEPLDVKYNALAALNAFPNIQFPKQLQETSYTTRLRLEYETVGDVTWFVESPPFTVNDKRIFYSGFERN